MRIRFHRLAIGIFHSDSSERMQECRSFIHWYYLCSPGCVRLEVGILCGSGSAKDGRLLMGLSARPFSFFTALSRRFNPPILAECMPPMAACLSSCRSSGDGP